VLEGEGPNTGAAALAADSLEKTVESGEYLSVSRPLASLSMGSAGRAKANYCLIFSVQLSSSNFFEHFL